MGKPEAHPKDPLCSYTATLKEWVGGTKMEANAKLPRLKSARGLSRVKWERE